MIETEAQAGSNAETEVPAVTIPQDEVSLAELAAHTAAYARAWGDLFKSEVSLARISLIRLLIVALLVPAIALGIVLSFDAALATVVHAWLQSWIVALLAILLLNIAALAGIFVLLRRWWQNLSLPRSRAALSRFLEGL